MDSKKKKKNFFTIAAVLAMLVAAGAVIISVKGLPEFDISLDTGYDERKEKRDAKQDAILGEWTSPDDSNFVIDIWKDGSGDFHAIVNRSDSENDVLVWEFDCYWQDSKGGLLYSDGRKTHATYDSDGRVTEEEIYTDGSGSFVTKGEDGLVWEDKKEKEGNGVTFVYSGEY